MQLPRELLAVKKHFEKIFETMSEGILEMTSEGTIVYANNAAIAMIGKPEGAVLASDLTDHFAENYSQTIREFLNTTNASPPTFTDDSLLRLNGKQLLFEVLPVKDEDSKRIVLLNDVTDRKLMEAQLIQSQKMAAVGTLAGGIAHDFNNLLMAILGNTSLILLDNDSTPENYKRLKRIEELVQAGRKLTNQLLGYARKGRYETRPIELNRLVSVTSETFGRARKEIQIHYELAQDLSAIEADASQIEQVLLNLYVNAADAMPYGGELTLKTSNINMSHTDMECKPYHSQPGNYVLLSVTDTGVGMDHETLGRIFDPFFTTKEMGKGTGLGLASVYGIVKGHGGYIDVESAMGEGTTFSILFPATEDVVQVSTKTETHLRKGNETVLLVDDEEFVLEVGTKLLEALGYTVLGARNGKEALEIFKANRDNISLVILDMIMPGMGGGEIYDRLKLINPNLKAILSSGYSIDGQAKRILERGCDTFIQKPFILKELSGKIREVLDMNRSED